MEDAGLDYECRRSDANRGNIVKGIINDLNDSYVVLADLTDQNANVFYELGVRHALDNRSIMLAQSRDDIPFDLVSYASHVYDWRSDEGKTNLTEQIQSLLKEVDSDPNRADNPVSDFVGIDRESYPDPGGAQTAQSLIAQDVRDIDVGALTRMLIADGDARSAQQWYRKTRSTIRQDIQSLMELWSKTEASGRVPNDQIARIARSYTAEMSRVTAPVEVFAVTAPEEAWSTGVQTALRFAGDWMSISQNSTSSSNRFVQGAPAFAAWRMLVVMGAKALSEEQFEAVSSIIRDPIEVEGLRGEFTHAPLVLRKELVWPKATLEDAVAGIKETAAAWEYVDYVQDFFESAEEYRFSISRFLVVVALADAARGREDSLHSSQSYPGYRLIPETRRAISFLLSKLTASQQYIKGVAQAIGVGEQDLVNQWTAIVSEANRANLGDSFWHDEVRIPEKMADKIDVW